MHHDHGGVARRGRAVLEQKAGQRLAVGVGESHLGHGDRAGDRGALRRLCDLGDFRFGVAATAGGQRHGGQGAQQCAVEDSDAAAIAQAQAVMRVFMGLRCGRLRCLGCLNSRANLKTQ
jgi:hypothetical protein